MILRVSILSIVVAVGIFYLVRVAAGQWGCDFGWHGGGCSRNDGECGLFWRETGIWVYYQCEPPDGPPCCLCKTTRRECQRGAQVVYKYPDQKFTSRWGLCKQRRGPGDAKLDYCLTPDDVGETR